MDFPSTPSLSPAGKGRIEHGVVYDPTRGEIFTASRGGGAHLENRRIRVSKQRQLDGALISTGFPYSDNLEFSDAYLAMMRAVMASTSGIRRPGAGALDLAYVACGRVDGFWELGLHSWDTAAGSLLITEAGGMIGTITGAEYRQGGNIIAGTPRVYERRVETLRPHVPASLRAEE